MSCADRHDENGLGALDRARVPVSVTQAAGFELHRPAGLRELYSLAPILTCLAAPGQEGAAAAVPHLGSLDGEGQESSTETTVHSSVEERQVRNTRLYSRRLAAGQ